MFSHIRHRVVYSLLSRLSSRAGRVVVLESDDWGMQRMSSRKAYEALEARGLPVDRCAYNRNDSLESNEDLEALFAVLDRHRGADGRPAILTANHIVANPDFERIRADNYERYHYEPFTTTLERYPDRNRVKTLYAEGQRAGLFRVQFHGREHLNVVNWLRALRQDQVGIRAAFDHGMFTVRAPGMTAGCRSQFLDAFGGDSEAERAVHVSAVESGTRLFETLHGFRSSSFIAPCYTWHPRLETHLATAGIRYLQGNYTQVIPDHRQAIGFRRRRHYTGQRANEAPQLYLVRNAHYEPFEQGVDRAVAACLTDAGRALKRGAPAIIGTHRANYIGSLRPVNRTESLAGLDRLLGNLLKQFPDVCFLSSDALGQRLDTHTSLSSSKAT